ncbi:MAG TPA: hypothetical protein VF798_02160, partial [Burkholderiaceae bacterium]
MQSIALNFSIFRWRIASFVGKSSRQYEDCQNFYGNAAGREFFGGDSLHVRSNFATDCIKLGDWRDIELRRNGRLVRSKAVAVCYGETRDQYAGIGSD